MSIEKSNLGKVALWASTLAGVAVLWLMFELVPILNSSPTRCFCWLGDPVECFNDGQRLFREGLAEQARTSWTSACDAGMGDACSRLGDLEEESSKKIGYYRHACDLDSPWGCSNLGNLLTDPAERKFFLNKSCDLGDRFGCWFLGDLQLFEISRESDSARREAAKSAAVRSFQRACDLDNKLGCESLERLQNSP